MSKIQVMNAILANKIAAGEVVERPASVVKELVENAIDARAKAIEIHLVDSGIHTIQIIDDGIGMSKEDAKLAFLRHATSKIQSDMDLFRIQSLGFRGEALPAIASVSKVVMKTGQASAQEGIELELHGGQEIRENSAIVTGTQFKITDLFYNTPARLNYLKSLQVELAVITDFVQKIAIAYPDIAFVYTNNDIELLRTRGDGDIRIILAKIFGVRIGENLISFEGENIDFKIQGYFARPENQRYNRNGIYLIINGRIVRNYTISKAIIDAFHTYIPDGRYPICYINVVLDPMLIDVNVHPTKQEVRITQERDLAQLITTTIKAHLVEVMKPADLSEVFAPFNYETKPETVTSAPQFQETQRPYSASASTLSSEEKESIAFLFDDTFDKKEVDRQPKPEIEVVDTSRIVFGSDTLEQREQLAIETAETHQNESRERKIPVMEIVGQYNGTYILAQNADGMYIVDQHAAAERIKYEKYLKQMGSSIFHYQQLTTPIIIELSQSDQQKIQEQIERLKDIGISFRTFTETSIAIDEIPTWIDTQKQEKYLRMVFDWLVEHGDVKREQIIEAAAIMLSCRLSIKANHALSRYEMQSILEQLELCDNPFTCPHGRPTIILKRLYDFEKWFKRV